MAELKGANRYDPEVLKLLKLTGTDDLMLQVIDMVLKAQLPQMEADLQNSEISDFPLEEYVERIQQRVDIDSLLYQMLPIYSSSYTRDEISQLIDFYKTPLGCKLVKESPQIIQEILTTNQAWLEPLIEKIMNDFDSIF